MAKLLFVCTANLQRSPTAEFLFKKNKNHKAKSVGIHILAEKPINQKSIEWADKIFVMENFHKEFIIKNFGEKSQNKNIYVLNIPDIYTKNDPELIKILKTKLNDFLD